MTTKTTAIDPSQSTLSPNFADYVYKMLAKGEAAASQPYQEYTGQRFAGPSALQQQAFQGLAGLSTPSQFADASAAAQKSLQGLGNLAYTPSTFTNAYQAPAAYQTGDFSSQYKAPEAYQAGQFQNRYTAPEAYKPTDISTQQWGTQAAQQYMNPFLQTALDPQLRELSRQSEIARMGDAGRYAAAGAFGGSRQAIADAEARRNLQTKQSDVMAQGYKTAYDTAQQAFTTDQARALEAQRARESAQQFGYGQQMTAAQLQAQYGLSADQAAEASRQFGAQQGARSAEQAAQFGLEAQRAQEASRQFGAQQGARSAEQAAQYGLETQRAQEAANQFGANYGLQGLQAGLAGASTLANIGTMQNQAGLANLQAQMTGGATQQQLAQQPLDFGYQQWQESMKYPFQQATYMQSLLQGLPLQAAPYSDGSSGLASAIQGGLLGLATANTLGKKP